MYKADSKGVRVEILEFKVAVETVKPFEASQESSEEEEEVLAVEERSFEEAKSWVKPSSSRPGFKFSGELIQVARVI